MEREPVGMTDRVASRYLEASAHEAFLGLFEKAKGPDPQGRDWRKKDSIVDGSDFWTWDGGKLGRFSIRKGIKSPDRYHLSWAAPGQSIPTKRFPKEFPHPAPLFAEAAQIFDDLAESGARAFQRWQMEPALARVSALTTNVWIKANGQVLPITPKNQKDYKLEEVQKYVGGYVEMVPIPGDRANIMLADEEGLLRDHPVVNMKASVIARRHIVGDVIVIPAKAFK